MLSPNEFYYKIDCPDAPFLPRCRECGEELSELQSVQYYSRGTGAVLGCGECIDEGDACGYVCECRNFCEDTRAVYIYRGTDCVAGCAECAGRRVSAYIE